MLVVEELGCRVDFKDGLNKKGYASTSRSCADWRYEIELVDLPMRKETE